MNKPVFSRPPLLIGIGGTTRPGSSTERASLPRWPMPARSARKPSCSAALNWRPCRRLTRK
ncbi:NADPH-dependent FMN reductase [Klebsiella pneumoniae subsp. pneumoniae]|nr:NADPH-dependent FMN reductase [Klebsiella pneumoniae subsp. pneumoniae]